MAALMKEIADAYMKINTHATIQVTATDSTKGLNSVMSGNCDMAMSSRDLKDEEKSELKEYQIAIDGIAVITNSANKVKDLNETIENLNDIKEITNNISETIKEAVGTTYSPSSLSIKSNLPNEAEKLFHALKLFIGEPEEDYEGSIHELSLGGANLIFLTLKQIGRASCRERV